MRMIIPLLMLTVILFSCAEAKTAAAPATDLAQQTGKVDEWYVWEHETIGTAVSLPAVASDGLPRLLLLCETRLETNTGSRSRKQRPASEIVAGVQWHADIVAEAGDYLTVRLAWDAVDIEVLRRDPQADLDIAKDAVVETERWATLNKRDVFYPVESATFLDTLRESGNLTLVAGANNEAAVFATVGYDAAVAPLTDKCGSG